MATRKKPAAAKPDNVQASQHVADTGPGDIAVDEHFADSDGPTTPVGRIRIRGDESPVRAAGHVLTEKGWVPER